MKRETYTKVNYLKEKLYDTVWKRMPTCIVIVAKGTKSSAIRVLFFVYEWNYAKKKTNMTFNNQHVRNILKSIYTHKKQYLSQNQ